MTTQLTDLDATKEWLGITTVTDDAILARLITAASAAIESYVDRTIGSASYTRTFNGQGGGRLILPDQPVTAVTSVTVDGVAIPAATGAIASGYLFDEFGIYLRGYAFSAGVQNVSISYTAGFATIPADLEQAAIQLVAWRYRERDRIGVQSKAIGAETVTFLLKDMPPEVKSILDSYVRVVPL